MGETIWFRRRGRGRRRLSKAPITVSKIPDSDHWRRITAVAPGAASVIDEAIAEPRRLMRLYDPLTQQTCWVRSDGEQVNVWVIEGMSPGEHLDLEARLDEEDQDHTMSRETLEDLLAEI